MVTEMTKMGLFLGLQKEVKIEGSPIFDREAESMEHYGGVTYHGEPEPLTNLEIKKSRCWRKKQ